MAIIRRPPPRRRLGGGGRNAAAGQQLHSNNNSRRFGGFGFHQCLPVLRWVLYPPTLLLLLVAAFGVVRSIGPRDGASAPKSAVATNEIVKEEPAAVAGGLRRRESSQEAAGVGGNAVGTDDAPPAASAALALDDASPKETTSHALPTESSVAPLIEDEEQKVETDIGTPPRQELKKSSAELLHVVADEPKQSPERSGEAEEPVLEPDKPPSQQAEAPAENSGNAVQDEDGESTTDPKTSTQVPPSVDGWPAECALYLAESTIPNAGMGMFTAVDLPKGALVGSPDVAVPVIDPNWHNRAHYQHDDYHFLYENYFWSARSMRMVDIADSVGVMSHGFGALANSHQGLMNLDEGVPRFDGGGLHRSRDVGAGQFSPYHDREVRTTGAVPTGSELFVDYGENWFTSRTDTFGYLPMGRDYDRVDAFLKTFDRFDKSKLANATAGESIPDATRKEYWDLIRHFYGRNDSRVINALPETLADAGVAIEGGGIRDVIRTIRSADWFREHGKCLDNIRPQPSTMKQAGRGAFATRFIPKGGLVIAAPLIQIPRGRDVFKMYAMNETNSRGSFVRGDLNTTAHVGYQLMMNYAFGHPESSVLLTPYGPSVSFINHNATSANARLQWADAKDEWLSKSVEWLENNTSGAQLSFDFVATRDIMPGEEVFLNYGNSWQKKWDDYAQNWSPSPGSENYVSASDMNREFILDTGVEGKYEVLRTAREQQSDPYPSNIKTQCRYSLPTLKRGENITKIWDKSHAVSKLHPCEILSKHAMQIAQNGGQSTLYLYTVKILEHRSRLGKFGDEQKLPGLPRGRSLTLTAVPRAAIQFGDMMYTNDIFLPNSFRHEIVVPDEIWPESWKNLARRKE